MSLGLLQQTFPPKPKFTDKDVPDLKNKVIIVTGSNTGLGKEVAQILYSKNAKVYMMARSEEKTRKAIESIKTATPRSTGEMIFLRLDLADLPSVKTSAEEFLRREKKLDVLFNSAGVGFPEKGSKTQQGLDLQLGVNCLGPFVFTKHLTSRLISAAKTSQPGATRVVWVASSASEAITPKAMMEALPQIENKSTATQYFVSKLGNFLHSSEFAARHKSDGVVSVSLNPGNLDTELWRTQGTLTAWVLRHTVLYDSIFGAYTILFAGFSPEVTLEKSGSYVAPWGRLWKTSKAMTDATKTKSDGGSGIARQFWDWTEAQVAPYI